MTAGSACRASRPIRETVHLAFMFSDGISGRLPSFSNFHDVALQSRGQSEIHGHVRLPLFID